MIDEDHIRELAERHTYAYKGIRYRVGLWRLRFDPLAETGLEPRAVALDFTATPLGGGDVVRLTLHLSIDNASDDVYLLDVIDDTIRKIVDGELPPGARDLL